MSIETFELPRIINIELLTDDVIYLITLLEDKIKYGGEVDEIRRCLSLYNQFSLLLKKKMEENTINQ